MLSQLARITVVSLGALTAWPTFLAAACQLPLPTIQVVYVISGTRIVEFDTAGNFITQFGGTGSGPGQFLLPSGITTDFDFNFQAGSVYVTDALLNRVQKFDSCGNLQLQFGSTGTGPGFLYQPYSIAIDGAGRIWIADTGNHRIQVFDRTGAWVAQFGGLGGGNGQFNAPVGISLGGSGSLNGSNLGQVLWVADTGNNRIQQFNVSNGPPPNYTPSLTFNLKFGFYGNGNGQFRGPFTIAADTTDVWVADSQNQRIQQFTPSGAFVRSISPFSFASPYGIALDVPIPFLGAVVLGVWSVDYNTNKVTLFSTTGAKLVSFGTTGGGPGQLFQSTYIATGPSGFLP